MIKKGALSILPPPPLTPIKQSKASAAAALEDG
jgi:hypothetical protein